MKRVTIINCFESTRDRVDFVKEYFKSKNFKVDIIQSDFSHMKKRKITYKQNGIIYINAKPYKKNISISRLYSHYKFAKDAFKKAKEIGQDIVYVIIPPNSLCKFAKKYKEEKKVKIIFDIYDLWPESIPSEKIKKILRLPFKVWRNIRNKNIGVADIIITECNLYQEKLKDILKGVKTGTIYLTRDEQLQNYKKDIEKNEKLELLYLGSINNLIDIELIVKIVNKINKKKKVKLNIIGEGENKDTFIRRLQENEIEYKYYGPIYDVKEKAKIFAKCDFGINIMKKGICVGLTMKSLDYFSFGIPILNNINGDTAKLVEKYNSGINLNDQIEEKIDDIINDEKIISMHKNVEKMYNEEFSKNVTIQKMNKLLEGNI